MDARGVTTRNLASLVHALSKPAYIRNVCVVAHVDHGKTSLCDHLVASNGYLSKRSAGQTRFLDAREDEQTRFITIKSSAIPLLHEVQGEAFLVNLVDSPGHIDFSVEVSAAARLCDGALLVVDVLEGFKSQSKTVLRQSRKEGLALVLVLTKMDRLIEARLASEEIYSHIRETLENVNACLLKCIADEYTTDDIDQFDTEFAAHSFSPEKGNVLFASSLHGWAFSMENFANLLATKLSPIIADQTKKLVDNQALGTKLMRAFWGDFYLDLKSGKISTTRKAKRQNIACSFAFQPLIDIYAMGSDSNLLTLEAIQQSIRRLEIPETSLSELQKLVKDPALAPAYLLSRWAPCAKVCLNAIVKFLPSPLSCLSKRIARFGGGNNAQLWQAEGPKVIYVAKSMSADLSTLRLTGDKLHGRENLSDFVGFGRIFSGSLSTGDSLMICDAESSETKTIIVRSLYIPAGMDLLAVEQAGLGAIVALAFSLPQLQTQTLFEQSLHTTAEWLLSLRSQRKGGGNATNQGDLLGFSPVDRCVTLSDNTLIKPFDSVYRKHSVGILRFGVSPENLADWPAFLKALALLYRADPAIHVDVLESGEFILCCQGQVHAERVVQDLKQLYCRDVPIAITPPLISVRETIGVSPLVLDASNISESALSTPFPPWTLQAETNLSVEGEGQSGNLRMCVRAFPMSQEALAWMDDNTDVLQSIFHKNILPANVEMFESLDPTPSVWRSAILTKIHSMLLPCMIGCSGDLETISLSVVSDSRTALVLSGPKLKHFIGQSANLLDTGGELNASNLHAVISGFQTASRSGPICEEPVRGVVFVIQRMQVTENPGAAPELPVSHQRSVDEMSTSSHQSTNVPSLGMLLGCTRNACRAAMEIRGGFRIYELVLRLEIQCEESILGKVHSLLSQKRAQVLQETMDDRSLEFNILARIPSTETFDLALELKRRSSGKASIAFTADGWQLNTQDPFPEAVVTKAEEEDEGTNMGTAPGSNLARGIILDVRRRKGLSCGEKLVKESANKQRTLGRSK